MQEKSSSAAALYHLCGLSGVISTIEGYHIRVQKPHIEGDYINRKSLYSILQVTVDERGRFIDIFTGLPGRVPDARMLRASSFYTTWQEMMGEYSWDTIIPKYGNRALTKVDQLQNAKMPVGGWSLSKPSEG